MITFGITKEGAVIPTRGSKGAAAYDFYSLDDVTIPPGKSVIVDTGICTTFDEGYYLQLASRSGLASRGVITIGGVVDSDYRGEIRVILFNYGSEPHEVRRHDRISQGILIKIAEYDDDSSTVIRGSGGFGSTGV